MLYIRINDCKHRHQYKLRGRNLECGVYMGESKGFVGIREKFGHRDLDTEYHYDTGFGTVLPIKELGICPIDDLAENGPPNEERLVKTNQVLFDWLDHCEEN